MTQHETSQEINIFQFAKYLFSIKFFLLTLCMCLYAPVVIYILNLEKIYRVEALLLPSHSQANENSNLLPQALSSFTGVSSKSQHSPKTQEALKILQSKAFIISFLKQGDLYPEILAANSWNRGNNKISYSKDFNPNTRKWIGAEPLDLMAFEKFTKRHLSIIEDPESSFIKISIDHFSPFVAETILNDLIFKINEHIRSKDLILAENSIEYLNSQLRQTSISEVRNVFSNIIESQLQKKLLANINEGYAFSIIDPPIIPIASLKPNKVFLLVASFLMILLTLLFLCFIGYIKQLSIIFSVSPLKIKVIRLDNESSFYR